MTQALTHNAPPRPLRAVVAAVAVITAYYNVPIQLDRDIGVRALITVAALALLGTVIAHNVRHRDDPLGHLLVVLLIAIATIALAFYTVAGIPGQFNGLSTRTDALYFTVVTLATIGYGDIHPIGQFARILVLLTVLFQVVFLAALIATIRRRVQLAQQGVLDDHHND